MAKQARKRERPLTPDAEFEKALGHFNQTLSGVGEASSKAFHDAVALTEDAGGSRFLVYQSESGPQINLRFEGATFWASQGQMAEMFGVGQPNISEHISKVFGEGELPDNEATHRKFRLVRREGSRDVSRDIDHYDLNTLISVGYRVGSVEGTMFRIWATDKLFQILTKGFYVDKERLKNVGEPDALDEFREIAREIRTSIRNSYREVLRLCTLCSDYDRSSRTAREFFMDMENKLLWAAAQKTAPQLVLERCDATKPDLGLTYYAGRRGPNKRDVEIGNNYLAEGEARTKNRITEMWLTYIEDQLDQGRLPTMVAVREKLEGFIKFNEWPRLANKGRHKRTDADAHAHEQLRLYREWQKALPK